MRIVVLLIRHGLRVGSKASSAQIQALLALVVDLVDQAVRLDLVRRDLLIGCLLVVLRLIGVRTFEVRLKELQLSVLYFP